MRRILLLVACLLLCTASAFAEPTIAERCQNNTVVVTDGMGHGSGVLFTRTDAAGNEVTFVWTVGHVANHVMRPDGTFHELTVIRGDKRARAIVLRSSDNEIDHDVALLRIVGSADFHGDAEFYRAFKHVRVGQPVIHVGTPLGVVHECSVYCGNVCYVDREYRYRPVLRPRLVDQINVTCLPGCSGGGVFDAETGGILGFVTIGNTETIACITPTRYIYEWAKSHDCLWAFDREVPLSAGITPWRGDLHTRIIAERDTSVIDARWGDLLPDPEPEPTPTDRLPPGSALVPEDGVTIIEILDVALE